MSIAITFAGGPADGRLMAIPDDRPPLMYRIPLTPSITDLFRIDPLSDDFAPMPIAEYEPLRENGWPRRNDDGAYLYGYRGTPAPPHPPQPRPTPTVDELAAMTRDPQRTAYPDIRSHLLACRTRHSLRRDAGLNPEEKDVMLAVTWAHIREERPDFPERWPF